MGKLDQLGDSVRQVIRAYHGSPQPEHFDKFDSKFLGTGQGAETYAHGHYSAQNQAVADDYRRSLSYGRLKNDFLSSLDQEAAPEDVIAALPSFDHRQQRFLRAMDENDWLGFDYPSQAISQSLRRDGLAGFDATDELVDARKNLGTGYELAIDVPENAMLDWDALATGQSPAVRAALEEARSRASRPEAHKFFKLGGFGDPETAARWHSHDLQGGGIPSGKALWHTLASMDGPRGAADKLRAAGVPGVRYLDSGSRGTPATGTRNFVMFPGTEDAIRIIRKFGWLIPATLAADAAIDGSRPESVAR
jgi:hypothetical protein